MTPLNRKKLFLFDIDGTIAVGDTLFEGSASLLDHIHSIGGKAYYITNNSTRSGADYVKRFQDCFSLQTTEDQFITSGYMTIRFLLENYKDKVIFVLGTDSFIQELQRNGLTVVTRTQPEIGCIVAAYDSELTYPKLTEICKALSTTDAPFYATNPDLCCPVDFGFIPDCGAICEMIASSTGKRPVYLGKPSRKVAELCMEASGFTPEETLVVGDRLYTDIACGINAGVDTCVVFTGEAHREELKQTPYPPDYAFEDINELFNRIRQDTSFHL